jgi:hypothetical protein
MAVEANLILQRQHAAVILARLAAQKAVREAPAATPGPRCSEPQHLAVEDNDGPHTALLENPVALRLSRKGTLRGPFSYAMHIVQNSRIRAQA